MPTMPFPGNCLNRIKQSSSAGVTITAAPTIIGITGAAVLASSLTAAGVNLIDLRALGPSAQVQLLMDGVGTATKNVNEIIYGVVEEDGQAGNLVLDVHELCTLLWTINTQGAIGYTGVGTVIQADAVTVLSSGALEAHSLGVGPASWPTTTFTGSATLQGRAGVLIPRAGPYSYLLRATWLGANMTTAFPKHNISVVI